MLTKGFQPGLHRFAVILAACTVFLLVAGASVTSNDAGLAVPDWPLSYGSLMPPMVGGIFYEHGHRMVATTVGFLTILLAVWLHRRESRPWMRRLGWTALAGVIVQGILGGITVKFFLPPAVSISHATLAQLFFCVVVSVAVFTSRWWHSEVPALPATFQPPLRVWAVASFAVVLIQLILGAAFRHKVLGILPHALWAIVVAFVVFRAAGIARDHRLEAVPAFRRIARTLHILLGLQLCLGGVAFWARLATADAPQPMPIMVWTTVVHVVFGALVLAAVVVLALCAFRVLRSSAEYAVESRPENAPA
jgi:cytochrome c oxidase assembly protein subunit 15